jgi:peptidoglycan-N-acetylglucosamine deacetylase
MVEQLAAVSVDLDEVDNYAAIHGLGGSLALPPAAIYARALPRIARAFEELAIPATFFAIGRDLELPENGERLRALHAAGHEIANHTYSHYYDLTRRSQSAQQLEVQRGADAIEAAVGKRPVGFRAPGYTVTDGLFEVLEREGVQYDSSVFACPLYYAAKAAAIGLYRARGRTSRSIIDDPRVLTAPADPYRVSAPYYRRGQRMLELPVGVTSDRTGRLPYLGTSVVMAGELGARLLTTLVAGRKLVNLVLHGMDLADAREDGLEALVAHQPDLRRSAKQKQAALASAVRELRRRGFRFVTLAEAARHYS